MTAQAHTEKRQTRLTGRHVLYMLLGFFGFIMVINGVFIFYAVDSWPGLSTRDAYRKGLAYNETLEAAKAQAARGWQSRIRFTAQGERRGLLSVSIRGRESQAISGLQVTAHMVRPTHEGFDQNVRLQHIQSGLYQNTVAFPLPGRWQVVIQAIEAGNIVYRVKQELMIK